MTEREMILKKRRKERLKTNIVVLLVFSVIFLLGVLVGWSISEHDSPEQYTLNLTGDVTVHLVLPEHEDTTPTETPKEPEEQVSAFQYTAEELDLLARLVSSEGGSDIYEAQLGIASVVMNRVKNDRFPNSIRDVIYAQNQFSVTTTMKGDKPMIDYPATESSKKAAKEVLENGSTLPEDVVYFYSKGLKNNWINSREVYKVLGKTVFAYIYG